VLGNITCFDNASAVHSRTRGYGNDKKTCTYACTRAWSCVTVGMDMAASIPDAYVPVKAAATTMASSWLQACAMLRKVECQC
jgi:hypothetical protein